jgi:hypothetical protein
MSLLDRSQRGSIELDVHEFLFELAKRDTGRDLRAMHRTWTRRVHDL